MAQLCKKKKKNQGSNWNFSKTSLLKYTMKCKKMNSKMVILKKPHVL